MSEKLMEQGYLFQLVAVCMSLLERAKSRWSVEALCQENGESIDG
jgi:hypothetical protein